MVKGSWLPRGMGWPLSTVLALPVSLGCPHRTGPGRGAGPMRGPGPGALGTIGANRRTHQSCRGRRCAPGDTHRLPSPGGTSLQDHTGRTGSSWHRTSPESSLWDRQGGSGVEGPRSAVSALGLGAGREFPFSGYLLSRGIQSSLGGRNSSHPGGGRPPPGGTGRAGRSWLPSVLEGTLQETRWLSGGAGPPPSG